MSIKKMLELEVMFVSPPLQLPPNPVGVDLTRYFDAVSRELTVASPSCMDVNVLHSKQIASFIISLAVN